MILKSPSANVPARLWHWLTSILGPRPRTLGDDAGWYLIAGQAHLFLVMGTRLGAVCGRPLAVDLGAPSSVDDAVCPDCDQYRYDVYLPQIA